MEIIDLKKCKNALKYKEVLKNLIQFSEYDFSEFVDSDVKEDGKYEYDYIDNYFCEEDRNVVFIKERGYYVGFAMINSHTCYLKEEGIFCVAEFFIMKKYRKKGYGKKLINYLFGNYKGKWELFVHNSNSIGQKFWSIVIHEYTDKFTTKKIKNEDGYEGEVFIIDL